jgi:mevalonate kinase
MRGKEMEHLKTPKPYSLILVDSGTPEETTGEMVVLVAKSSKFQVPSTKLIIGKIGKITQKIREKMELGAEIQDLVNENGKLLEEIGVVGEKAKTMSQQLRTLGFGVKITGAGGVKAGSGRLMVVGANLKVVRDLGYEAFEIKIGGV